MKTHLTVVAALAAMMAASAAFASCPPNQKCESTPPARQAPPSRPAPPANRQTPPSGRPVGVPQTFQRPPGSAGYVKPPTYSGGHPYQSGGATGARPYTPSQGFGQRGVVPGRGPSGQVVQPRYGAERGFRRPMRDTSGRRFLYRGRSYSAFRADRYRWPRGYGYHRFYAHQYFPRQFWIPDYYIDDWADYGVYAPPYDTQWIRYGSDLVLVNLDTGEILDVVPGVFVDADYGDQGASPGGYDQGPPQGYDQGPPPGYDQGPPDDQGPPPSPY